MSERVKGIGIGSILTTVIGGLLVIMFTSASGLLMQIPVIQEQNRALSKNLDNINQSLKGVDIFISDITKRRAEWDTWRGTTTNELVLMRKQIDRILITREKVIVHVEREIARGQF